MERIVSQLDGQGYFVGAAIADQDPLDSDNWLVPGGAVEAEPPSVSEGKRYKYAAGQWIEEDLPVVESPEEPADPTFEQLQQNKLVDINAEFQQAASALTAGYPEAERLTWPTQQSEALAWSTNNSSPTPFLDGLAAARGIEQADMRQKTLEQVQLFMQASQMLVGTRQKLADQIAAAENPDDLAAIQWPHQPASAG